MTALRRETPGLYRCRGIPPIRAHWHTFLTALAAHDESNPSFAPLFVSIAVAGPTASSEEIMLPADQNWDQDLHSNRGPRPRIKCGRTC